MVAAACIGLISLAIKGTKDSQESESASPEPAPTSDDTARRARLKAREERLRAAEEAHHRVQGANKRLVEAAELVRTAEQEWDYARAQFGLSATERFHRQVEEAKAALSRGYDTQKRIQAAVVPQTRMRLAAEMSNDLDAAVSPCARPPRNSPTSAPSTPHFLLGSHRRASAWPRSSRTLSVPGRSWRASQPFTPPRPSLRFRATRSVPHSCSNPPATRWRRRARRSPRTTPAPPRPWTPRSVL